MENIAEILHRPANPASAGRRVAALLSDKDEFAFGAMTLGDIISGSATSPASLPCHACQRFQFQPRHATALVLMIGGSDRFEQIQALRIRAGFDQLAIC